MNSTRLTVAGIALVTVSALGACGGGSSDSGSPAGAPAATTTTAAAAPAGALGELVAAAEKTTSTTARVAITTSGLKMSGGFDAAKQLVQLDSDFGGNGSIKIIRVGNDLYFKAGGAIAGSYSGNGKKWLHVDGSTRPAGSSLSLDQNDPSSTARLLATAADDVTGSGGEYKGTLDMTQSPSVAATVAESAKDKYKAVPFTASVADGYLTEVTMDLSSVAQGAGKSTTAYSGFGDPIDVTAPPAAQTQEMTAQDMKKMGG